MTGTRSLYLVTSTARSKLPECLFTNLNLVDDLDAASKRLAWLSRLLAFLEDSLVAAIHLELVVVPSVWGEAGSLAEWTGLTDSQVVL